MDGLPVSEHRHFIRHPLCFPLSYKIVGKTYATGDKEKRSTTINISVGGLLFAARHPAGIGAKILIKIPFQDKLFNVVGRVVHCAHVPEMRLYNIGVSFEKLRDAFKVKLIEQIYLISEFRDLWSIQLGREVSLEEASREWIKRYSKRFKRLYW